MDEEKRRLYVRDISRAGLEGKGKMVLSTEENEKEIAEVDDEIVAGLEGGKDGEGNDQVMEGGIVYYQDDEDEVEVFDRVENENDNENENDGEGGRGEEGESPTKKGWCI